MNRMQKTLLEEKNKEIEEKALEYERIFEGTQSAMFLVDVAYRGEKDYTFRFLRNNDAHQKATGITTELLQGKTPEELVGKTLGHELVQRYRECIQAGRAISYEEVLSLPGGEKTWHTMLKPVWDRNGQVDYLVGSSHDITDRKAMEKSLVESETLLRSYKDFAPMGVHVINEVGDYVDTNPMGHELLGYTKEELLNMNLFDLTDPESMDAVKEGFALLEEQGYASGEVLVTTKHGSKKWFDIHVSKLNEHRYLSHFLDVTDRKEAEYKIAESEHKLRSIIHAATTVSLVVTDLNSVVQEFSSGAEAIFGYNREELVGESVAPLHAPSERTKLAGYIDTLKETGTGFTIETTLVRKSGDTFPARFTLQPMFNNDGALDGTLGISIDISELQMAEEKLRKSEERFRQMADNIEEVFWLRSADNKEMLYISPAYEKIWGRSRDSLYQSPNTFLSAVHQDDRDAVLEAFVKEVRGRETFNLEYRIVQPQGQVRWVWARSFPVRDKSGEVIRHCGVAVDVTERKKVEHELKKRDELLEKLSEQVPGAIYQYQVFPDQSSCFPFSSHGIWDVYEVTPDEVRKDASKVFERVHPEDFDDVVTSIQTSYLTMTVWESEYRVILPGRGLRWLKGTARPETQPDGSVIWHGYIADITEKQEAEEALKASEEKLGSILNNMRDVAWSLSWPDLNINYLSPSVEHLYGHSREAFTEDPTLWQEIVHPDDVHITEKAFEQLFQEGVSEREARVICPDGSITWIRDKAKLIYDGDNPVRIEGIATDITDYKLAAEKLATYTRELETQNLEVEKLYDQLNQEINKAKDIHEGILPCTLPAIEGAALTSYYQPAERMGGDFYNVLLCEDKLIFYLSDVMGHGLEAAIVSAFVKESMDSYINLKPDAICPKKMTQHLYRQYIQDEYPDDYFISFFIGVLDLNTKVLKYTGAGFQESMLVALKDQGMLELHIEGPPISNTVPKEFMTFQARTVKLSPGATILVNTDGLTEQTDAVGSTFHHKKREVFEANYPYPPEFMKQAINDAFEDFNDDSWQGDDDITYLVIQLDQTSKKTYQWVLKSQWDELQRVTEEILPFMNSLLKSQNEVTLQCVYELVINALEHGNTLDPSKEVFIQAALTEDYFLVTIEDEGEGFPWQEKKRETLDIFHDGERGRGILMTRMICESLVYNDKGNKALLIL